MTRTHRFLTPPCLALALALAACAKTSDDARVDTGAAATASAAGETEGAPTERPLKAHVVLTGGTHAGTYEKTAPDALCAAAATDASGANLAFPYTTESLPPGTLQNVQFSAEKLSATGTDHFVLAMDVTGTDNLPHSLRIEPPKHVGTGSATITGTFPVFTAKVHGTTADGVKVDATLECAKSK